MTKDFPTEYIFSQLRTNLNARAVEPDSSKAEGTFCSQNKCYC